MKDYNNGDMKSFNVDNLLKGIFNESLSELFDARLKELGNIPLTKALELMDVDYRSLKGILSGKQRSIDMLNLVKLSSFLQISPQRCVELYLASIENRLIQYPVEKIDFINQSFDIATLKDIGLIDDIKDYAQIESRLCDTLGISDIFQYKVYDEVAFSAGVVKPKDARNRSLWVNYAKRICNQIDNPNTYSRERLLEYIPNIRWHSTNVQLGLRSVIRDLYHLGVTVIFQQPISSLHLRGATLKSFGRPCIVLTDLKGYYATFWFSLIHEIYHILFDLSELKTFHISGEPVDFAETERENSANNFAREFIFSKEKTRQIKPHLANQEYVEAFAERHQVHSSIIYTFFAFDMGQSNRHAWIRANKFNPDCTPIKELFFVPWSKKETIDKQINKLQRQLYY